MATEEPRIDKVTGEYERSGKCDGCGKSVTRTKKISAPTYQQMLDAGEEWGKGPLMHAKCEKRNLL